MNLNVTHILRRCALCAIFSLSFLIAFAAGQPDFNFQNGQLIAGVDRQVGAVYKYTSVRTGVDARVTIMAISAGVQIVEMDGASGYPEALQPTLRVAPNKSGYMEMKFQLYIANTLLPYISPVVNVTCIDVDGMKDNDGQNHPLYEFDNINLGGGYVDFDGMGGELVISQSGGWFTGKNIGAIDYPGRDTAARQVMFTVSNVLINTFTIRVGVDNQSNQSAERLRSVYFKKFNYQNIPLAMNTLTSFEAAMGTAKVNLNWTLAQTNNISTVALERSYNAKEFAPIANYWLDIENNTQRSFAYADNKPTGGIAYYRLKIISAGGKTTYSNVLYLKETASGTTALKVYPTETSSNVTVNVNAANSSKGIISITDLSGKLMKQQPVSLQKGMNTTTLTGLESMSKGTYVVAVRYENNLLSNYIVVR
jgi:hypothetical protein